MNPQRLIPELRLFGLLMIAGLLLPKTGAQDTPKPCPITGGSIFDESASTALAAMKGRADALHIGGVAVVAYAEGDSVTSWSSKMLVVGSMTKPASQNDKGSNFLAIAYAKASEMASTLSDSGSGVRPILTGELGWHGGVVAKGKAGILIAAFSGGRSEDDVQISKAGLEILAKSL